MDSPADYPGLELETLAFWESDHTFEASIAQRVDAPEYVFYDGPPFANGLPHYGHLLTGFVKDAIPRYKTMRGMRVDRRFGWDCHGLPAETAAERELGVSGRGPITEYGIDRFNEYCKSSVLRYTEAWKRYVNRQARWVDFEHGYKTMDITYMESVMWAFAELNRLGLIYEGYRVLPYCWECETPLSNFETRQDDAYRERVDPAVTVSFDLEADEAANSLLSGAVSLLVWTTTPWTLPSNLALAVGPELDYRCFSRDGKRFLLAESRVGEYEAELEGAESIGVVKGAELVGRHYRPLFPYFASTENAFVVLSADFVTTDEGTGVVHMAPGFGEDDQRVCEGAGIQVICPVDDRANFDSRVPDFAGLQVFEANAPIIAALGARGALVREERYSHSYPHCWRTDTPLIYRAVSSFFVEVTKVKDRLLENNQQINWVPEYMRDSTFGKWLEGARDWSISRNRFWGAPIPVWKSDDQAYPRVDVYGSIAELEADFGVTVTELHRPFIDELVRPNPDDPTGKSKMRRVTDVLDCWFESGAMPFAQLHYPFENKEWFESHFPADFICEYVGQTRGWFYTLHVLATALFDRPAFSNCLAHGNVLGDDGRKLSKRLQNFPDPEEFFGKAGADTMRWFMLSSPVLRGLDVAMESDAMAEPIRRVLNPIWNSWYFLCLYAGTDHVIGEFRVDQAGLLDRYILAKTTALVDEVTESLDRYDLASAANSITGFLDALTNWYIRRSRERFWRAFGESEELDADKHDAYDTLHTVLELLCRVVAPLLPYLAEEVYRPLTGNRSVHLSDWPQTSTLPSNSLLVSSMDLVREICSAAHSIRKANGLRARLPLRSLTFAAADTTGLAELSALIQEEVNVKEIRLTNDVKSLSEERLSLIPAAIGPRLGARTQEVIVAVKRGEWHLDAHGEIVAAGISLLDGEFELLAVAKDAQSSRVLHDGAGVVVLDCVPDLELEAEGTARDIVRNIQAARKTAGLHISDRIALSLSVPEEVATLISDHLEWIAQQTLASEIEVIRSSFGNTHELSDGTPVGIDVRKI